MDTRAATERLAGGTRVRSREHGWALLFVMLMAAIFVITAAAVLPKEAFEARRQREADLMYRGKSYQRAVQLYFRKFRKYPSRLEDLEETNQIRFLRRRWPDPITGKPEWRLLHMNAAGIVLDSINTTGVPGATGSTGSTGSVASIGLTPSLAVTTNIATTTGSTTSGFGDQSTVLGAGIAGVASKSDKASIMTYNTYQKYNQWEFVYDYRKDTTMQAGAVPGVQPGTNGTPNGIGATGTGLAGPGLGGQGLGGQGLGGFGQPTPSPSNPGTIPH